MKSKKKDKIEFERLKAIFKKKLLTIMLSIFNWKIPETDLLTTKVLESELMLNGCIQAVNDMYNGVIFGAPVQIGDSNIYGYPKESKITTKGGYNSKVYKQDNYLIGYNNNAEVGFRMELDYYAEALAKIELTKSQNLVISRGFITGQVNSQQQKLSIENAIEEWLGFDSYILYGEQFGEKMQIQANENNFKGNEYNQYKKSVLGDFLEAIGVKSIDIEKGSHILNAEASRSEASGLSLVDMYNKRKEFCKELKNKFDYDLNVEMNLDKIKELLEEFDNSISNEEVANNE